MNKIWIEKYRPGNLDGIVGQKVNVEKLRSFVRTGDLPHMIFAGPAGTGKTTAAMAMAIELFGESWKENFLELNASNNRGINVIRGHEDREGRMDGMVSVKDYARIMPSNARGFKIIFLDEADQLTQEAQAALRRTMEIYSSTTRFIFSCNYSSQIIPPIQSRCVVLRFRPISDAEVAEHILTIAKEESMELSRESAEAVADISGGDMRAAINLLQAVQYSGDHSPSKIYEIAGTAEIKEFDRALILALEHMDFKKASEVVDRLVIDRGLSGIDIVRGLHAAIRKSDIEPLKKTEAFMAIADAEFRLVEGGSDKIQLDYLVSRLVRIGSNFN
ncbi:MAG: replication factor C small subunit [Candidatus Thermoplasmatota archaeon]|jgi:replication factor C small subunit|nr:replication factor C small subunit [Candidatus Thermoplasmatota archaeon]